MPTRSEWMEIITNLENLTSMHNQRSLYFWWSYMRTRAVQSKDVKEKRHEISFDNPWKEVTHALQRWQLLQKREIQSYKNDGNGEIPYRLGRRTKHFFIRVWKPPPNKHVLKTLRGSPKQKAQRGQYLLVVGLSCYNDEVTRLIDNILKGKDAQRRVWDRWSQNKERERVDADMEATSSS